MIDQIRALEARARLLEPDHTTRQIWEKAIHEYSNQFLEQLDKAPAYITPNNKSPILAFEEQPKPIEQLLEFLGQDADKQGLNTSSPKHFGYIPGGGLYTTAIGDYLAAVTNRYAGLFFPSPGAVRIENQLLRWMCQMVGYPEGSLGNLTSGGSIANLEAVIVARDKAELKGADYHQAVVYLTDQVHHCVQKALRLAGMSEAIIRYIPVSARFKMRTDILSDQIEQDKESGLKPFLVVGSAGTTNTGAIDPLDEIADLAENHQLWFHVDAAYGGFFTLLERYTPQFQGIERSDSITIDPHKGLFLSYGSGAILVRDPKRLYQSNYYTASYMQDVEGAIQEYSPADLSPELTKHFRGLRMWMSIHLLGIENLKAAIEEKILLCQYFYGEIRDLGFEVGPFPELSVMIYRYVPEDVDANAFNKALVQYTRKEGRIFISTTTIDGVYWLRMAVMSFRTHLEDMQVGVEVLKEGVQHTLAHFKELA